MSGTTVSLTLQLKGQQAQQVLNQLNQAQKNTSTDLLRTNRLLEGVLRQQTQQTKAQNQQLQQLTRLTQQNARNVGQTAAQNTANLNTNRQLERILEQQTRQANLQSQQLRQQNRDYQIQVNMLRQQAAAAERLRQQLQGARQEQQQAARSGGSGMFQTAAGVAGGVYAAGAIGSNYLKDPRDYMRQISLSTDTALAGQNISIPQFNQKVTEMSGFARKAAVDGGSTPQQVVQALNTLTASNVYGFNDYKDVLYQVSKTAFASGADANDVASMAVAQKNFGLTDLGRANDMAFRSGQLGSFELRDMARYMPDILTQGKNAGYIGETGYRNLLTMMQMSKKTAGTSEAAAVNLSDLLGSFSQYHLGLSFAKHVKLDAGDPIAKYGVTKKRSGFDWTTYAANMREKGVGEVEAAALLMQRQMSKNPLYMEYQNKAQKALARGDNKTYTENVQAATSIVAQSEIGKIFHNKQALLSFMGITMNMGKDGAYESVDQGTANSAGAVDVSHARQAAQEYGKDSSLDTARFNARLDVYNGVADKLGNFKQSLADYASQNQSVAAASSAAVTGLMAVAAAGGIAALTMRGGGGGGLLSAAGGAAKNAGQVGLAGALGYGFGTVSRGLYMRTETGQKFDEGVGSTIAHVLAALGNDDAQEAIDANKKYEAMLKQQDQANQYTQETNKKLDQLIQVTSQNGQPIVTLDGNSLMSTLEKKVMHDSSRNSAVPYVFRYR